MLHDWHFAITNPVFEFRGLRFSAQIFTDGNRYDLDVQKCKTSLAGNTFTVTASGLEWAGGQEKCAGTVSLSVTNEGERFTVTGRAAHGTETVRRIKIVLFDQPAGEVIARRRYNEPIRPHGSIFRYPNGWDDLFTPLITVKGEGGTRFYRSLDTQVRPKTFYVCPQANGLITVEMIFEQDARKLCDTLTLPAWETGVCAGPESIFAEQAAYVTKAYGIEPWETRPDIAPWVRNISLVLSVHGMHWSGYIFNTYAEIQKKLEWFASRIDPARVLVYIPGFDGRYYQKYCDYTPDKRMGGAEGAKKLMAYAHAAGYHVMPMFMINGANPDTPGFHLWGEPSRYRGPNGFHGGVGSCDWDTSRSYNLGCGVGLNPGAPLWQDRFVDEVSRQMRDFGYDAVFLDLAAVYVNDPVHSTHEGSVAIVKRLQAQFPGLLVCTEGWYDAFSAAFPLSQCAGQGDSGEMIWHDTPYAPFFDTSNRFFGHLCLGDPAAGRNGVFEWGINPSETRLPVRKAIIPTLTVVDDTIERGEKGVMDAIADAALYYDTYIKNKR